MDVPQPFFNMPSRLPLLLLILVLAPLGIISWFGLQMAEEEAHQTRLRFEQLLHQRLEEVARPLAEKVEERQRQLLAVTAGFNTLPLSELRALSWAHPEVEQFFLFGPQSKLLFPDPQSELSQRESAFIERTRQIWHSPLPFLQPGPEREIVANANRLSSLSSSISVIQQGWYSWHWTDGLSLLFWQQLPNGAIAGAELDRLTLLSDLIAFLPDSDNDKGSRIRLLDSRHQILYQWGSFEPATGARAIAELPLQPPLESWRLAYFAPPEAIPSGEARRSQIIFGLVGIAGLILVSLIYLYRELTRTMREASQRVNFVNQVSHELKTPLTNIRLYAELLQQELEPEDNSHSRLQVIVDETQRLSRLIGNILGFARGQRKTLRLHPIRSQLDQTLKETLSPFLPLLKQQGFEIETQLDAPTPFTFDPDAVAQIIGNLLNNVEKYAIDGGYLRITSQQQAGMSIVEICDRGPGIPPRMRKRIFKPFFRIRNDLTEGVSGTGIGLSISRDLARLHGGDLSLESSDQGACFRLCLPGVSL